MIDPRFIPPSDRDEMIDLCGDYYHLHCACGNRIVDHAAFMDEQSVRDRDLIRRLANALLDQRHLLVTVGQTAMANDLMRLIVEARGIEAPNE